MFSLAAIFESICRVMQSVLGYQDQIKFAMKNKTRKKLTSERKVYKECIKNSMSFSYLSSGHECFQD